MDAKQAVLAGALLNAELMEQRDEARQQVQQLVAEVERLTAVINDPDDVKDEGDDAE